MQFMMKIVLDEAHNVVSASTTAYEDETMRYTVVPEFGPFDGWEELLQRMKASLDQQLTLW